MNSDFSNAMDHLLDLRCDKCKGHGWIDDAERGDIYYNSYPCPECGGTGWNNKKDEPDNPLSWESPEA